MEWKNGQSGKRKRNEGISRGFPKSNVLEGIPLFIPFTSHNYVESLSFLTCILTQLVTIYLFLLCCGRVWKSEYAGLSIRNSYKRISPEEVE